ncbi:hypothetical protein HMPREF9244_00124 [Alloscardovia omnicolens F0580]|uniref:Uncharacterized protein n=1 Tax=Alloscardovia omnicolens F0580 TaxID=1321816 RepID=U1RDK2_9BIFI|nr:hypothetical protein HMPREF9244_00124 [Alloscardovia omnicolens F0580]
MVRGVRALFAFAEPCGYHAMRALLHRFVSTSYICSAKSARLGIFARILTRPTQLTGLRGDLRRCLSADGVRGD